MEGIYPKDAPSEARLEPTTVRWLDEIAQRATQGDLAYLPQAGRVFQAVSPQPRPIERSKVHIFGLDATPAPPPQHFPRAETSSPVYTRSCLLPFSFSRL